MGKRNDQFVFDLEESASLFVKACQDNPELWKAAKSKRFSNYCRILALIPDLETRYPEIHRKIIETIKEDRWDILWSASTRVKNKIGALASLFGGRGIRFFYHFKVK